MMNINMRSADAVNDRGEQLFTAEFDDGGTVVPITATAEAFYDLATKLAGLAQSAEQWARTR
jgi:hypothetical protein